MGAVLNHSAEEAGARHLDLSRVVFVGHSAGGHLALWAASRGSLPAASPLHAVTKFARRR
ncbi:hypothetical protein [Methylobacterium sp. R2-1]|uniref:hypothetical protein n=1 Tax=Methylobacterium sp. R2-1 TaxID=2587064 RepID=UPI0028AD81B2|nr:hypothetical protein [Methylobacterium sp. R2-1]